MGDPVVLLREGEVKFHVFRGSPVEMGRAHGSLDPAFLRTRLDEWLTWPHDFDHPYFRENMAFMRREFPDFMERMEAYGAAAGIEDFDHTYYLHIVSTGREEEACSAFGILLQDDGPALLRTYDPSDAAGTDYFLRDRFVAAFPDCRPHGYVGMGGHHFCVVHTSLNDAGLLTGWASGAPKFHWPDNPEHVNLFQITGLVPQHCSDCEDVRRFLSEYRISGLKGLTGTAVDARGNILGFELESGNIAFREPEDDMVLEVNHWQHPHLQRPARTRQPEFWTSPYFYNSQNRVQYVDYFRETFRKMRTFEDLIDFSFDVHAPGRILQMPGANIADWMTSHAIFLTAADRRMRVHPFPLDKDRYTEVAYCD